MRALTSRTIPTPTMRRVMTAYYTATGARGRRIPEHPTTGMGVYTNAPGLPMRRPNEPPNQSGLAEGPGCRGRPAAPHPPGGDRHLFRQGGQVHPCGHRERLGRRHGSRLECARLPPATDTLRRVCYRSLPHGMVVVEARSVARATA